MSNLDAGKPASERTPMPSSPPRSTSIVSPAARKFAEYLARRMLPMVEHASKQEAGAKSIRHQ
jgi:hypothetical protein